MKRHTIPVYGIDYELITFNSSIKCKHIPNKSYIHTFIYKNIGNVYDILLLSKRYENSWIYSSLAINKRLPHITVAT